MEILTKIQFQEFLEKMTYHSDDETSYILDECDIVVEIDNITSEAIITDDNKDNIIVLNHNEYYLTEDMVDILYKKLENRFKRY